jgi:hypothetical protein
MLAGAFGVGLEFIRCVLSCDVDTNQFAGWMDSITFGKLEDRALISSSMNWQSSCAVMDMVAPHWKSAMTLESFLAPSSTAFS